MIIIDEITRNLTIYKKIDKKVADSCNKVFQRHTWYLTEENISFSLFNENLPISVREKLAAAIVKTTKKEGRLEVRKPELPDVKDSSTLADFAGPRSRLLFDLVGVNTQFLEKDDWHLTTEYEQLKSSLRNLSATNDSAERAISLMTTYNTRIARKESCFQDLLQVVRWHQKQFSFESKEKLRDFK